MSIAAGQLNRVVTWQARTAGKDAHGQKSTTWADAFSTNASIRQLSGREQVMSGAMKTVSTHEIVIRHRTNLTAQMRGVYQGRLFDINSIDDVGARHEFLRVLVTEGATSDG